MEVAIFDSKSIDYLSRTLLFTFSQDLVNNARAFTASIMLSFQKYTYSSYITSLIASLSLSNSLRDLPFLDQQAWDGQAKETRTLMLLTYFQVKKVSSRIWRLPNLLQRAFGREFWNERGMNFYFLPYYYLPTCSASKYVIKRACTERAAEFYDSLYAQGVAIICAEPGSPNNMSLACPHLLSFCVVYGKSPDSSALQFKHPPIIDPKVHGLGLFANGSLRGCHFW